MNEPDKLEQSPYTRLASINVNEHTEKKNGLTYLSWAWAVDQLLRADPGASWEFHEPTKFGKDTFMVSCTVTAFGVPRRMWLPVMDHRNKAISDPDAFSFNTAMMRCLVKCIALHGLGLYIYAGEDLPDGEDKPTEKQSGKIAGAGATGAVVSELSDEDRAYVMASVQEAVAVYRETSSVQKVDFHLREVAQLTNEMLATVPYFLGKAQTDDGKKLSTAWTAYTKKVVKKPTPEDFANTP